MSLDEGELGSRYPEIPWDQPVKVTIVGLEQIELWVCRYCIALHGLKAQDVIHGQAPAFAFVTREDTLAHIENAHHD